MPEVSVEDVKKLREETGVPVMEIRKALQEANGDVSQAKEILKRQGALRAEKRASKETAQGVIETYIHSNGKVGAMIEVNCETDFVARTDDFKKLAHEVAMQVAAMNPGSVEELLNQDYIRDPGVKIKDLVNETVSKTGESIKIRRMIRFGLGE